MSNEPESPRPKMVAADQQVGREPATTSAFGNGQSHTEKPKSKQTDSVPETQIGLRLLLEAFWEAMNVIEEKAPDAPIERELVVLDRVAEAFEKMMCELPEMYQDG